jgi:hypothetical protein
MFDIGDSGQPRSCLIWRGAFASRLSPPASPCGDTDGFIEEMPEPDPRTRHVRFRCSPEARSLASRPPAGRVSWRSQTHCKGWLRRRRDVGLWLMSRRRFCIERDQSRCTASSHAAEWVRVLRLPRTAPGDAPVQGQAMACTPCAVGHVRVCGFVCGSLDKPGHDNGPLRRATRPETACSCRKN